MRKLIKWIFILIGLLVFVIVVAGAILYFLGQRNLDKTYRDITVEVVTPPEEGAARDAALARGEHLVFAVSLCADCHGDDLGGKSFVDDGIFGSGDAPNLTAGQGGIGASYTTSDWVRALRHGVKPDDKAIRFMPAAKYAQLSDEDLIAIITYVTSVPPVDRETSELSLSILGTIIGGVMMDPGAEEIDHEAARPAAVEAGVTAEYGQYLVTIGACQDCHGEDLTGHTMPGAPSGPDLTQDGDVQGWTEEEFVKTLRTGLTPYGKTLDHEEMPWNYYTRMTDDELSAVWAYLVTLE